MPPGRAAQRQRNRDLTDQTASRLVWSGIAGAVRISSNAEIGAESNATGAGCEAVIELPAKAPSVNMATATMAVYLFM